MFLYFNDLGEFMGSCSDATSTFTVGDKQSVEVIEYSDFDPTRNYKSKTGVVVDVGERENLVATDG